jgi:hypothetical protein
MLWSMFSFEMHQAMVKSLRVRGVIFENTPFSKEPIASGKEDLRVHIHAIIPMDEAMGPCMKYLGTVDGAKRWEKIAED